VVRVLLDRAQDDRRDEACTKAVRFLDLPGLLRPLSISVSTLDSAASAASVTDALLTD